MPRILCLVFKIPKQEHSNHGKPHLNTNGIGRSSYKAFDAKELFKVLEKDLYVPASFLKLERSMRSNS